MRRRRHSQNVRDYSKTEVLSAVAHKLGARLRLLAPCPFTPADVYKRVWDSGERAAIRLLMTRMPSILIKDDDLTLMWDTRQFTIMSEIVPPQVPTALYVRFPKPVPVPQTETWRAERDTIHLSRLPDHLLDSVEEWAKRWTRIKIENTEVYTKVDRVFNCCNTMGQIHRLWPNLCSFLPERGQEVLRRMKVRSKLPESVLHYDDENDPENEHPILDEEWTRKALVPYDTIITEALLLPEVENYEWDVQVQTGPLPT